MMPNREIEDPEENIEIIFTQGLSQKHLFGRVSISQQDLTNYIHSVC